LNLSRRFNAGACILQNLEPLTARPLHGDPFAFNRSHVRRFGIPGNSCALSRESFQATFPLPGDAITDSQDSLCGRSLDRTHTLVCVCVLSREGQTDTTTSVLLLSYFCLLTKALHHKQLTKSVLSGRCKQLATAHKKNEKRDRIHFCPAVLASFTFL
jgi:hypothetical protein